MTASLAAQNNIIKYGKNFYELKVLVHHSDSKSSRIVWISDFYFFSILVDFAFFRLIKSKEDAHQC